MYFFSYAWDRLESGRSNEHALRPPDTSSPVYHKVSAYRRYYA